MAFDVLTTKLYAPQTSGTIVERPRLLDRFDRHAHKGLILVSAPAGYGKSTLVAQWLAVESRPAAWLSLDRDDSDPTRFLIYLVHALRTVVPVGESLLHTLSSDVKPDSESVLTSLLNEVTDLDRDVWLVLDDFHEIDSKDAVQILSFIVENRPEKLKIVVASREDPPIPLAKLRAGGQLAELRIADLKFSSVETTAFFKKSINRPIGPEDIQALDERAEGWIAGLQLAAISIQNVENVSEFITSLTGTHRFILDYLLEEVLNKQSDGVQKFLVRTSILDRFCASLCDAVVGKSDFPAEERLRELERSNMFLVPLDNERRWYRYHHLFAELLRGRVTDVMPLHHRASEWLEANGYHLEAFFHSNAAGDIPRSLRLLESGGVPLYFRGPVLPVVRWIESIPESVRDERPELWIHYGWALWTAHRSFAAAEAVEHAERAIPTGDESARRRSRGLIAALRAMLAANSYDTASVSEEARRALSLLPEGESHIRTAVIRAQGMAYHFQGRRSEARTAYQNVIARCESSGNVFMNILTTTGLGMIEESQNAHRLAEGLFDKVLEMVGRPTQSVACEAWLGLARIAYDRNELDSAWERAKTGAKLAAVIEGIDTPISGMVLQARILMARGNDEEAEKLLDDALDQAVRGSFHGQIEVIADLRVCLMIRQGRLTAARLITDEYHPELSSARVALAQGAPHEALVLIESYVEKMETLGWADELQKAHILEAAVRWVLDDIECSVSILTDVLESLRPEDRVRPILDEGAGLIPVLEECVRKERVPEFATRILVLADCEGFGPSQRSGILSRRELEVLRLVAGGYSNKEIGEQLYVSLSTIKGHNARIFEKLGVRRRTEAIVRANELGLL